MFEGNKKQSVLIRDTLRTLEIAYSTASSEFCFSFRKLSLRLFIVIIILINVLLSVLANYKNGLEN